MKSIDHILRNGFVFPVAMTLSLLASSQQTIAQVRDTLRIVTHNALNFCGGTCAERIPAFRAFYPAIDADIVVTQEQVTQSGVNQFLNDILNDGQPETYAAAPWTDGNSTDNALFYKASTISFVSTQQIQTQPSGGIRDISEYVLKPRGMDASGEFRVYSLHLKAGDTSGDEAIRLIEATVLRNHLNGLPDGTDFLVMGDFNCYSSDEDPYQKLVGSEADNSGRCFDPISTPGDWNNDYTHRFVHTQSTRTTGLNPPDGGATGGMDDRFDQILSSEAFLSASGFECLTSTYTAYGNDGNHFNDSINDPPNTAVPQESANGLHRASDHIPVYMDFLHPVPTIAITSPNGGETWHVGQTDTIFWTSNGLDGDVTISINRDYPAGGWETLFSSTADDGEEPWVVTGPTSENCRIRVVGDSYPAARDSSDADFAISDPFITVVSPNGGEQWYTGEPYDIVWSSGAGGTVDVSVNRDFPSGGWEAVFEATPNDGAESWTVTGPVTSNAGIRIISTHNPSIRDSSDDSFAILAPYLILEIPNGGDIWTAGEIGTFVWIGEGLSDSDSISVHLNRHWPSPDWEYLGAGPYIWFGHEWPVTGPGTTAARARIASMRQPGVRVESEANFIIIGIDEPPLILHDPLGDGQPGNVIVVASAFDEQAGVSVKLFYRTHGAATYDSVALSATGNPYEFAATVGPLAEGSYEYYIRALDSDQEVTATEVYDFQLAATCGVTIAYDNGSADRFNWAGAEEFRWAVRFTPETTPFLLCGAQFSVSRTKPDSSHEPVVIEVYDEDGLGFPGTLMFAGTTGSVGNVIGGLPSGTTLWATAVIRDETNEPLILNGDFFIAVGNSDTLEYEAFARDTTGPDANRSFLYDGCEEEWYNENDLWENCKPGNRLIRAIGFNQEPPVVVLSRSDDDTRLTWRSTGAPHYRIYSAANPFDAYTTLEGSTSDSTFLDADAVSGDHMKFYRVVSSTQP